MLAALLALAAWPWRVEATLKATTRESAVSLAGGLELAGLSGSAAAILGGPGVVAIHLRARELWRRPIAHVSVEALIDLLLSSPSKPKPAKKPTWLLSRTDVAELPGLGLRVVLGLRDVSFQGAITCGFSDPVITGKAAAWLFPIAAVLAPLGTLDVSFDWSGRDRLDGGVDISFRVVLARVVLEALRFARHHVHLRRKSAPALPSSRVSATSTT